MYDIYILTYILKYYYLYTSNISLLLFLLYCLGQVTPGRLPRIPRNLGIPTKTLQNTSLAASLCQRSCLGRLYPGKGVPSSTSKISFWRYGGEVRLG